MDEERWQQVQEIFSRTADLPEETQPRAVMEMCAGDASLQEEVLALLEEDRRANPLLDSSLDERARAMLDFGALPSLIQQQIGPYRLLELLGEGGMGVVYLAERTDIGGRVAIKLLRDGWLSPMRRERFRLEQQTLAQLNHPNIARIYDSNTLEDGTPWFVMEYADGLPLTEYWKQNGGTVRVCLLLFRRVCEAVQYAHSHAIIHRDLKPSNILVTKDGEVKLLDFGIAKQLNAEDSEAANRTVTGLRLMTLAYAAPEQIAGKAVGVYSDVYALGVLFYELLTGQLPGGGSRVVALQADESKRDTPEIETAKPSSILRRERPQARSSLSKAEWADLDVLTLKALEPDPERRYRTADALMRDLDALLDGRPLEARPPHLSYTIGKFIRRNRRALVSVAAMLLLVTTTIVFYTVRLAQARNAAVQEAARTLRIQQFTESLFDGGDKSAGPAMDLRALDLLERGRKEADSLSADPEMQAEMQLTLGTIYQKLGKLDLAGPLIAASLEQHRKAHSGDDRNVANGLVALGLLRKDQGKLDEAESLVRQGLEMIQKISSKADPDTLRSMVALGAVLEVHGKYDQARELLEAALKLQPQGAQATAETSENLTELANVHFYQGNYDQSEALNNQALEIDRRLFGEEHPSLAQEYNNLGAIEDNRGNYTAAEKDYRKALAITEAWYGTDHPETAANLTALAQELSYENRDDEARSLLERALAIQKKVNGPLNSTVATTLNQIGVLAYHRHDYGTARDYFTQALETYKHLYGDEHSTVAVAYSNLGSVCLDEKDYSCAEKMYREAVRRFDAIAAASVNAAIAHLKLGRALLRNGNFREAEPETLAGYKYLVKQVASTNGFLTAARKDLTAIYEGLHNSEQAAHYRAELTLATSTHP
jgi:serine/threonine protein kinase/tetratricopeptide (TPR) repeat protein